ncbi:MAG: hypothetical protein ACJAYC_002740 [Halieaceae bacterium]|jgi:hypothetical protein
MAQLNDLMYDALRDQGFTGALTDMRAAFAEANDIPPAGWHDFYGAAGFTEPQKNDRAFAYWLAEQRGP